MTATRGADLKRATYRDIPLYSTPRERCATDLSDNTNLWGAPPSAWRALRATGEDSVTRYPVAYEPALREALGNYVGVAPDMIVAGCGSDDVLDSAIRAFAEPGDILCLPAPSFSMIPVFARSSGLTPIEVPLTSNLDADAAAMLGTGARITYLCSPNNPTGAAFPRETVERIVEQAAGLVIIDQAYSEFGGESFTDLVSAGRPVLVTRTLSKAFGLAGLRVGYGIGSPDIIGEIMKARGPYKVNALGERAAIAALQNDQRWVADRVADVIANRARFRQELSQRGIASLPSHANFVLVPVRNCGVVARQLRHLGIGVRELPSLPGIGDALRIGIGPWDLMERCLDALGAVS
ncbi:MAG TPA: histidinol-phosphate transaminase [Gemmatimonadaceae bacterium]|nr:histidinol-phosphate transaminase [Gemmatimonadaceae bacterium]